MTITYDTAGFAALLFKWRASLWQAVWKELVVYLLLYYALQAGYRYIIVESEFKNLFETLVVYLDEATSSSIPIFFLLGQYVVTVVKRWWQQFENIGWPDNFLFYVSAYIRGDERRLIRRNIARYSVAAAVLAWRNVSSRVLKRFPTAEHLVKCNLLTPEEMHIYQNTHARFGRWFLPINWIQEMIILQHQDKQMETSQMTVLLSNLHYYKDKFRRLFVMDWVTIPLVYTQVVTVATYGYFFLCLIGRQNIELDTTSDEASLLSKKHTVKIFPIFSTLEFLFYMGWLKVAEKLMHPFGEQDDDFELNYIIDRHMYTAYMIVDDTHGVLPSHAFTVDPFWDKEPVLPHTKASSQIREQHPSSYHIQMPFQEMALIEEQKAKV